MDGGRVLKRADPSTIQDKFMVGYQGWFTCAGDGEVIDPGHHGWLHWFDKPIPDGGRPNIDLWPDVSEYSTSELYPTPGITLHSGEPATLFSSRHPKTVQRHFHWMARHSIDGVFLQRFLGACDLENGSKGIPRLRDEIGDRVQEAAEKEGRVFSIMYDVSGVAPDQVMRIFTRDWIHLIRDKGILNSPNYLKERGMPVIALWGFGFDNRNHTPELVREVTNFIRQVTPGGAYIMAGTPTHWRRAVEDADRNPAFLDVWLNEFDAISPWMVGRLSNEQDVDNFAEHFMKADIELLKKSHEEGKRKIDYIPVIYPGFSGLNLTDGKWGFNQIKRNGGKFLWQQVFNAKRLGLRVMYGAMWDEYDEGTALMPVVEKSRMLPHSEKYTFMALDADGYDLPADWYMRICGFAAEGLRSERLIHETFPSKELQDYWATRPHYEEVNTKSGDFVSGSSSEGGEGGQSYQNWLASQKDNKDELPPPPYSLEAEEAASASQAEGPQSQGAGSSQLPTDATIASLSSNLSHQSLSSSSPALDATSSSIIRPPLHPSHPSHLSRTSQLLVVLGARLRSLRPQSTHPALGHRNRTAYHAHSLFLFRDRRQLLVQAPTSNLLLLYPISHINLRSAGPATINCKPDSDLRHLLLDPLVLTTLRVRDHRSVVGLPFVPLAHNLRCLSPRHMCPHRHLIIPLIARIHPPRHHPSVHRFLLDHTIRQQTKPNHLDQVLIMVQCRSNRPEFLTLLILIHLLILGQALLILTPMVVPATIRAWCLRTTHLPEEDFRILTMVLLLQVLVWKEDATTPLLDHPRLCPNRITKCPAIHPSLRIATIREYGLHLHQFLLVSTRLRISLITLEEIILNNKCLHRHRQLQVVSPITQEPLSTRSLDKKLDNSWKVSWVVWHKVAASF
ncbi:hypothetical protein BT96DRAFT_851638 [Gymnopus androsaceus JB14]|uniref:Xylosidase/arabinosidase n=1 Tax=Gymnopus androsaceus JB14 TaxID=1447944 RepID=A0A6A4IB91_9AGAR|nr:hypothetical protein BT96DRAFT_851638 [Gymnopus androsaceus JB14]